MINFSLSDALLQLSATPGLLRHWLSGLPDNWLNAREGADTFSPFDVVGHLIHGEKTDWMVRAGIILQHGESRPFDPYDRFAQYEESSGKSLEQLLDEFDALRAENLRTLKAMAPDTTQLDQTGTHPRLGRVTLRQLLATWVTHDLAHIAQIARVMAKQYKHEVGPWTQFMNILHDRQSPGEGTYDWTRFTVRIPIDRPVADIFRCLNTGEGLEYWFLRKTIHTGENGQTIPSEQAIQPGDRYAWWWHGYPDSVVENGVFLESNGANSLRFSFAGNCVVTIQLNRQENVSVLELTQSNIPTDENSKTRLHLGCMTGWLFYITNLKSLLEGGNDLRNRNEKLANMVNA